MDTREKLKNALHYVCQEAQGLPLGKVRLNKIILLADVVSFVNRRRLVIGATFVKGPYGPVPDHYEQLLEELRHEGKISVTPPAQQYGTTALTSLAPPDISGFDADDLAILREVTHVACTKFTAAYLSQVTHTRVWEVTEMGEAIPLAAYFPQNDVCPPDEALRRMATETEAAEHHG
jgi:hypothetical protein